MEPIILPDMDLEQLVNSGQCFSWQKSSCGRYLFSTLEHRVEVGQEGALFSFSCTPEEFEAVWRSYFDLNTDYGSIKGRADPADAYLTAAIRFGNGIRILRQDFWEVLVSFLISQNNNITRIRRSVLGLCEVYGAEVSTSGGARFHAFPTPDALAGATAEEFRALGLGYRAEYLTALAAQTQGGGLAALRQALDGAEDGQALELLRKLRGVGPKVADCVCLFGLHRTDRFPVDTHIRKLIAREYPCGFPFARYQGALGIVQQYLFYYDLHGPQRDAP